MHYLVGRQTKSAETAIKAVAHLLELIEICPVNRGVLEQALAMGLSDFEDAVQVACAITFGLDAIITRDLNGFTGSPVSVLSPTELKARLV